MKSVAVIDYGMGNLRSVSKALEHVAPDAEVWVTSLPERIRAAERVVLPGVGAIRDCVSELLARGLTEVVRSCAADRPFLGICLGMQALLDFSEENTGTTALGILPGYVTRFPVDHRASDNSPLKVPHMGWNQVRPTRSHPLWRGIPAESRFYFVHSYHAVPADPAFTLATTRYGLTFASAIGRDNLFAVQFHPEKSQAAGLTLLANFMAWNGDYEIK
ncbi:Imidazole glycerol phosphate synthase subunit HisH [Gammaproteobacteria bacterium]